MHRERWFNLLAGVLAVLAVLWLLDKAQWWFGGVAIAVSLVMAYLMGQESREPYDKESRYRY